MSRKASPNNARKKSRINRLRPLAGLLAAGLSLPALAASRLAGRSGKPASDHAPIWLIFDCDQKSAASGGKLLRLIKSPS